MICKKCNIDKECSDFHKKSKSKTRYQIYCKLCNRGVQKSFYEKNTNSILERKSN